MPIGRHLVLPGHQTVLAATLEFIKLPVDLSAMVLTKSSWARTFITVETAPWIHPCYRGCLTLELANVSETPLALFPGHRIAQLVLFRIEKIGQLTDRPAGSYIGAVRPEAPRFATPEQVLHDELGFDKSHVILPWSRYMNKKESPAGEPPVDETADGKASPAQSSPSEGP